MNSMNTRMPISGTALRIGMKKTSSGIATRPAPKPDVPRTVNAKKTIAAVAASWGMLNDSSTRFPI